MAFIKQMRGSWLRATVAAAIVAASLMTAAPAGAAVGPGVILALKPAGGNYSTSADFSSASALPGKTVSHSIKLTNYRSSSQYFRVHVDTDLPWTVNVKNSAALPATVASGDATWFPVTLGAWKSAVYTVNVTLPTVPDNARATTTVSVYPGSDTSPSVTAYLFSNLSTRSNTTGYGPDVMSITNGSQPSIGGYFDGETMAGPVPTSSSPSETFMVTIKNPTSAYVDPVFRLDPPWCISTGAAADDWTAKVYLATKNALGQTVYVDDTSNVTDPDGYGQGFALKAGASQVFKVVTTWNYNAAHSPCMGTTVFEAESSDGTWNGSAYTWNHYDYLLAEPS